MKITNTENKNVVDYDNLANGDAFWSRETGICIKTSYGAINLQDGMVRNVSNLDTVRQVEATVTYKIL